MSHELFERHRALLDKAVNAIRTRAYWSAYPEVPSGKIYGETAKDEGETAFKNRLNKPFAMDVPDAAGNVGAEQSPYGFALGITYPRPNLDALMKAAQNAMKKWSRAGVEERVGVCMEILHRLNRRSFEIANAVMHTTGQGFMMSFQAGGPHAQDRGLEAVAYAWDEMNRVPRSTQWQKQVSKTDVITLNKTYHIAPRGVSVVIGCSTFPTWNSYPAIFASLATGNAVVVKPHGGAILPLAITVEIAREVLKEAGFDPNVITLAADDVNQPISKLLVTRPETKIVDYTGSSSFGQWIEENAARDVAVFTEKAGVNSCIIDSIGDLKAVTGNLAFTLSLYSGQMCTTTQNIFIPRDGVKVGTGGGETKAFDEVAGAIVGAVNWFLGDPKRAAEVLGAIQNAATTKRIAEAEKEVSASGSSAKILRKSEAAANEAFPAARVRGPLIVQCDAKDRNLYMREMFGPIAYIIATDSTQQSIDLARECARDHGAITWSAYATDPKTIAQIEDAAIDAGVPLSVNLTGQIFVNQAAAFSDYHVSGANPSGNATLTDAAFVTPRFRVVQSRVPAPVTATNAGAATEVKPAVGAGAR
jgi:phenylacetic acid degradation protein paaN